MQKPGQVGKVFNDAVLGVAHQVSGLVAVFNETLKQKHPSAIPFSTGRWVARDEQGQQFGQASIWVAQSWYPEKRSEQFAQINIDTDEAGNPVFMFQTGASTCTEHVEWGANNRRYEGHAAFHPPEAVKNIEEAQEKLKAWMERKITAAPAP